MNWYTVRNAGVLDTPCLVLYPERIKSNLKALQTFVADKKQLRPHVKTNKCPDVIRMMLAEGITRFKCATIAEAEMLALEGATDVLLAYQPVGPKARRFCTLQRNFPGTVFSCLIDNQKSLRELSAHAEESHLIVKVLVDLNSGMNRTGIAPGKEALDLYLEAGHATGIEAVGLHCYDGHLHDKDPELRKKKCDEAFDAVAHLRQRIKNETGKDPLVVAGGTPTFPIHAKRGDVECSPGTFVFWDQGYKQMLEEQPFEFAALVVTRIISIPGEGIICTDLGHKSIASENPIVNRVYFLNASGLQPVSHSEEHMVFRTEKNHPYQVGDVLYGVPYHICPTVALYDEAAVCIHNAVEENWPVSARKRKLTI